MLFKCPPTRRLLKSLFAYDFSVLSHSSKNKSLRWILFHPEKEMNPHFFCIFSSAASWLSVFLTASNSSFIILCFCSHTRWYFYPWNSRRVTPNARLPTSDAKRNFQQSFFFFVSLIPCWRPTSVVSLEIRRQQIHTLCEVSTVFSKRLRWCLCSSSVCSKWKCFF